MMNNLFKKKFGLIVLILVLISCLAMPMSVFGIDLMDSNIKGITDIENTGNPPEITADSAVLIDAATGQILYDKNCHEQKYPASTTKVMTALLAIENLNLDDYVVIDKEVEETSGSSMYLVEGEKIKISDLLHALMMKSANDSAVALAKAVSGSVEEFAKLMNEKAVLVGAKNTNFTNPNGLPDEEHLTTAYDLAIITKAGFGHEYFRELVSTVSYSMEATNLHDARTFKNGNKMLWDKRERFEDNGTMIAPYYEGANGVKTGYTKAAGNCLIASVNRDGHELIGVVLNSKNEMHYVDMKKIFDYGFDTYDSVTVCTAEDSQSEVKIKKSKTKRINVGITDDIKISLPVGKDLGDITTEVELEKKYEAPVLQFQKMGKMKVYYDGQLLCSSDLVAMSGAEQREMPDILGIALIVLKIAGILAVILVIAFILFTIIVNKMYRSKKGGRRRRRNRRSRSRSRRRRSRSRSNRNSRINK